MQTHKTDNNEEKQGLLRRTMERMLNRVLRKGFYGEACISLSVQDGSIQDINEQVTEKHKVS